MMETVKNTVFSLCVTAILGSVLFHLLPKGSFQKLFRLIFCLFFLCSLTSPFIRGSFENQGEIMKNNWTQNFIDKETKSTFATSENFIRKELERKTKDYLAKQDIIPNRINLDVHISEDGSIFIKQFFIVLETKDVLPELADKIEETIGIKPELYFGEENEHETI